MKILNEQKKLQNDRKGQTNLTSLLTVLMSAGIIIVIIIVGVGIGSETLDSIATSSGANTKSTVGGNLTTVVSNITDDGQLGLGNLVGQTGLVGTVVALSVVLLVLITLLFRQFSRGRF